MITLHYVQRFLADDDIIFIPGTKNIKYLKKIEVR